MFCKNCFLTLFGIERLTYKAFCSSSLCFLVLIFNGPCGSTTFRVHGLTVQSLRHLKVLQKEVAKYSDRFNQPNGFKNLPYWILKDQFGLFVDMMLNILN